MKKVFSFVAVAAALLFAGNANAQMNVSVGYMPETITTTMGGASSDYSMNGFFVGFDYTNELTAGLNLSVGLRGRYNTSSETILGVDVNHTQIVLDIPILLNYGIDLGGGLKLVPFLGPTVSFALVGNDKSSPLGVDVTTEWYGDDGDSDYSRLNLYGTAGLSIYFNQYRIFGGYNLGLLDLHKNSNVEKKSSGFFVGLGMDI